MSDIVEKLQQADAGWVSPHPELNVRIIPVGWLKDAIGEIERKDAEIERLRAGFTAIKKATIEGRVCDDVAWFDDITTLHDFCDLMLPEGAALTASETEETR